MPRSDNMHASQIQWPPKLWKAIRRAALEEGIPASEFVRRATRDRLRRIDSVARAAAAQAELVAELAELDGEAHAG